jgi:DnaJ domain
MELKDYYFILGVPRTATDRDILHAYRELAKLYHPDRVGAQGTATFQDIVEAYEVLSDPERRRHYTNSLSQFVDVTASAPPVGSARPEPLIPAQRRFRLYSQPEPLVPEPMSLLADFGTISPSFDALSDHLLQNFTGRATPQAVQLASLTVEVRLSPYEALQGVMVPLGIPVFMRCAICGGTGRDWYTLCLSCQGQGMVETERTVHVHLPPRVREGTMVEVPLHQLGIHNVFVRVHIRISTGGNVR